MQATKALLLSNMLSSSESVEDAEIATFVASCVSTPDISVDLEPIQAGTGDPSPTNIRPISGRSEVSVTRTGKELWDSTANPLIQGNWGVAGSPNHVSVANHIPIKGGQSYTLKHDTTTLYQGQYIRFYDSNKTRLSGDITSYSFESLTFTAPDNASYILFNFYRGNGLTPEKIYSIHLSLRLSSQTVGDAPYTGTTHAIQLGQTVYGGTVDVTEGVLKVTKAYATLNDLTKWKTSTSSSVNFEYDVSFSNAKNTGNSYDGLICSYVPVRYGSEPYGRWIGAAQHKFGIKWVSGTLTDIQADATAGRIAICYELATPVEVTLTPQQIQTLVGENNVWSDSGNISVRNFTCNADFLDLFLKLKLIGDC